MSGDILHELQVSYRVALQARQGAMRREAVVLQTRDAARANVAEAARIRTTLFEALEHAAAAEQAGRDRLGACRLSHADCERALSRVADLVASGGCRPGELRKAQDAEQTAAALVGAHERRVRQLAEARGRAELALTEHDQAEHKRARELLEGLLTDRAAGADRLLAEAAEAFQATLAAVAALRRHGEATGQRLPAPRWSNLGRDEGARHTAAQQAFQAAFASHNPHLVLLGAIPTDTLAKSAETLLSEWRPIQVAATTPAEPKLAKVPVGPQAVASGSDMYDDTPDGETIELAVA